MENENIFDLDTTDVEEEIEEITLRPKTLNEYIGQTKVKENMKIYIEAAKRRNKCLDHVLLYGAPGLRKNNTFKYNSK